LHRLAGMPDADHQERPPIYPSGSDLRF
jgi:hypothetical protein